MINGNILETNQETIIVGDMNVDLKALYMDENKKTTYQKGQNQLSRIIKEKLMNNGMCLLNDQSTFFLDNGYESQIDFQLSN